VTKIYETYTVNLWYTDSNSIVKTSQLYRTLILCSHSQ